MKKSPRLETKIEKKTNLVSYKFNVTVEEKNHKKYPSIYLVYLLDHINCNRVNFEADENQTQCHTNYQLHFQFAL